MQTTDHLTLVNISGDTSRINLTVSANVGQGEGWFSQTAGTVDRGEAIITWSQTGPGQGLYHNTEAVCGLEGGGQVRDSSIWQK